MSSSFAIDSLLRIDERLAQVGWQALAPIPRVRLGANDCIVVATGFEDRALAGLQRACEDGGNFAVALIRYLPRVRENQGEKGVELCKARGLAVSEFVYNREEPAGIGIQLAEHVRQFDRVIVDVSGMSRLLIVQTVVALMQHGIALDILYAEALVYPPDVEVFDQACADVGSIPSFISSGIFEVVSSPELSSVAMLGAAIRLISFPSFDPIQLSNLVQEVQPTYNNVVHGIPPDPVLQWRTEAIKQSNQVTLRAMERVESHETSTLDYRETLQLILKIYWKHAAFDRIVIAPTGSKMQAVAVGVIRAVLSDIQIVYPTPLQFEDPERYTEGVKQLYSLSLPCAEIMALMES